jgi:APA family basic amino acid/polyamine antiporter
VTVVQTFSWGAFGMALLASLWAYDGWNNLPMVAGEIENPKRNIPLSLIGGMLIVLIIYLMVNFAYFQALPLSEIQQSNSKLYPDALPVGTKAALTFLGPQGLTILCFCFVLSALGAMNGSILTGARVPYAMAKDGLFFSKLAHLSDKTSVPIISVMVQATVASLLALSGTFDQLTDYVVFASWIFYALVTGLLFKLRKSAQTHHYQTPLYPVLPVIFILVSTLLLINTVVNNPSETLIGLGIILAGLPCFFYFKKTSLSI